MQYNFQISNKQKVWVISDTHWHHSNILWISDRPFENLDDMHSKMVEKWNAVVGKDDIVIHLGDFSMSRNKDSIINLLNKLNGKIILIFGNHDKRKIWDQIIEQDKEKIILATDLMESKIQYGKDLFEVVFCHYPLASWNKKHYGTLHLHGHCHGTFNNGKGSCDCGVDSIRNCDPGFDYGPVELIKILTMLRKQKEEK